MLAAVRGRRSRKPGFDHPDGDLLLEREIQSTGKSRVYVNNRPATVALLKELAPHLGDIHGQHDQQLLFEASAQLSLLDAFAQTRGQRVQLRALFSAWKHSAEEIAGIEGAEQERLRMLDLWQFQKGEIDGAELKPGEDVDLELERRIQQNAGRLLETSDSAYEALYESPESAWSMVRSVAKKLDELAKIDTSVAVMRQSLEPALIAIQDVSYSLRDYVGRIEANPARLEDIETRLAAIDKLKRKYGGSVDKILVFLAELTEKIEAAESAEERLEALKKELKQFAADYESAAAALTAVRCRAAIELAKRIEQELKPLAMDRTVFRIALNPAPWSESGADRVEFLVSPNPGEEPKAMEKIASGGELSRIALALKTCLVGSTAKGPLRTLVFDEIDTGIGGRAAEGVARRLKKLAAENQVLCVTHLAQIACFADHHYTVSKQEHERPHRSAHR